jgi:serine/threonine-protein kinase
MLGSMSDAANAPQPGRLLGEGASARVFAALDTAGREIVVKILKPELARNDVVRTRFLREARAAAQVSHPRLVAVHDHGASETTVWLTLPYLRGGSLADALRSGPLDQRRVVRLAEDVAGGLDALHASDIVHRDLKPSNILFDDDDNAYVADFGLAKARDWTGITGADDLLGTPHYLAPEIIGGDEPTAASDIYAFGCVLWEAIVGEPPFAGRSFFDVGLAHIGEAPPDVGLSPDVAFALGSALEKNPARRPRTAHALAAMLRVAGR